MPIYYRLAEASDFGLFANPADEVFDAKIDPTLLREFLSDPRHHIALAMDGVALVGFVSAVDYVHPDKRPQLWINEVGVAPTHHRAGAGFRLMQMMLEHARNLGCSEAWVLTDAINEPANRLYQSVSLEHAEPDTQLMYSFPLN